MTNKRFKNFAFDAATIGLVLVYLFPIIWLYSASLKPTTDIVGAPFDLLPRSVTLSNFTRMWNAVGFQDALRNSLVVALATAVVVTSIALLAAFSLSRFRYRLQGVFATTILAMQMLPGIVMVVPLIVILRRMNLTDNILGLMITYLLLGLPVAVWMLKGYMDEIPPALDEAAMIDGATDWQVLTRIIIPLMAPATVAVAAFTFMLAWGEYLFALSLMTSTESKTLPLALQAALGRYTIDWGMLTAGGVLISIPPTILFIYFQRYLLGGLTSGSVKG
ncbi:MAG: carbohydrate ABC transporter permease [Caldilineaceae bacterium]|nr:carbohydrate ABC transporter permease [Caldilineaceae bacterium]